MEAGTSAEVRTVAQAYKALGDETRLRILILLLAVDELCVCRFEEVLGIGQSKASRHLRYLTNAGLLEYRREGVWVHYRVPEDLPSNLQPIVDSLRRVVGEQELGRLRTRVDESVSAEPAEDGCQKACAG